MKLINADQGYEILDNLFAEIQRNNYQASQKMLDDAWKKWCELPAAYDVDKVAEQIGKAKDEYGMVDYINDKPVIAKEQAIGIIKKGSE